MNKTNDYKFNLPAYSDPVDIEDLNDNFRGIDDALMAGLCKKDYTGNNMGSSDPSARKYAWAPWLEIVNDNEFDVVVTDRNAPVGSEEATINIAAGQTFRKYINGRYYMNFYVQDQHDVTFKWFTNAETYINESGGGGGGTGTVTSVSVQGGSGSHLTGSGNPIETSGTITINVDEGYSIPQTNKQTAWDGKAADLKLEINSSTFVITAQLKDSSGNLIGNERTIDLPLETMVVDGEYDPQTQKIKLELKNGNYVEFSVADLVSGLQTELSASNKLDPDYIDYDSTHRAVTDTEKDTWNGKQNALTFDDTPTQNSNNPVKSGGIYTALAGKQASLDSTQLAAVNSGIDSAKVGQISTNQTNILYGLQTGVKNLFDLKNADISAVTNISVLKTDTSLIVTTTGEKKWSHVGIPIELEAGTYHVLATISGRTADASAITRFIVASSAGGTPELGGVTFTNNGSIDFQFTTTGGTVYLIPYPNYSSTGYNATFTASDIMICTKAAWDQEPNAYQPFALPNYDLTYLQAEDRAALAQVVDSGAKNLFEFGEFTGANGATVTMGTDTVTVSGTQAWSKAYRKFKVTTSGTYVLYYKITNNNSTHLAITVDSSTSGGTHYYSKTVFNPSTGVFYGEFTPPVNTDIYVVITSNNTSSTLSTAESVTVTDVMICTKAAFGVSNKFVPYRPNWDLVGNTVNYVNDTFRRLDYGSNNVTTISVNVSTWQEGTYLVACNNATSNTSIKGTSVYMFTLRHSLNFLLFTKIAEMATSESNNSNITNMTINNDTITISYEYTGYHSVYAVKL